MSLDALDPATLPAPSGDSGGAVDPFTQALIDALLKVAQVIGPWPFVALVAVVLAARAGASWLAHKRDMDARKLHELVALVAEVPTLKTRVAALEAADKTRADALDSLKVLTQAQKFAP